MEIKEYMQKRDALVAIIEKTLKSSKLFSEVEPRTMADYAVGQMAEMDRMLNAQRKQIAKKVQPKQPKEQIPAPIKKIAEFISNVAGVPVEVVRVKKGKKKRKFREPIKSEKIPF